MQTYTAADSEWAGVCRTMAGEGQTKEVIGFLCGRSLLDSSVARLESHASSSHRDALEEFVEAYITADCQYAQVRSALAKNGQLEEAAAFLNARSLLESGITKLFERLGDEENRRSTDAT